MSYISATAQEIKDIKALGLGYEERPRKVRYETDEYCSQCGNWRGFCAHNPLNKIDDPHYMPGCRFFVLPVKAEADSSVA